MTKRLMFLLNAAVIAVLCYFGARQLRPQATKLRSHTAFTVRMHSTARTASSTSVLTRDYLHAYRKDGSTVTANIVLLPDNSWSVLIRTVHDVAALQTATIDHENHAKSTERIAAFAYRFAQTPRPSSCVAVQNARQMGTGSIAGFDVIKFLTEDTRVRAEHWQAVALDCFPLYNRYEFKDQSGAVKETTEETSISVTTGEPDPELFVVPADYDEVPPSELLRRRGQQVFGQKFTKRDEVYARSHSLIGKAPF